jgi:hypothetical protein
MIRVCWVGLLLVMLATRVWAQPDLPTELDDCTGPDADFCFDGTVALIDSGCGARFEGYLGRISWPVLRSVGPVTLAVQTRFTREGAIFPLYVEVRGRTSSLDSLHCNTGLGGNVVLVAPGADQCGGTWESVGPLDLRLYGVPLGAPYSVQCVFFTGIPHRWTARSVGFSCIRVTSYPTTIASIPWGSVKSLYRDPTR